MIEITRDIRHKPLKVISSPYINKKVVNNINKVSCKNSVPFILNLLLLINIPLYHSLTLSSKEVCNGFRNDFFFVKPTFH